jgi:hypothetical protein
MNHGDTEVTEKTEKIKNEITIEFYHLRVSVSPWFNFF